MCVCVVSGVLCSVYSLCSEQSAARVSAGIYQVGDTQSLRGRQKLSGAESEVVSETNPGFGVT